MNIIKFPKALQRLAGLSPTLLHPIRWDEITFSSLSKGPLTRTKEGM